MQPPVSGRRQRQAEFFAGARDTLPMLVGAAPFGVIFGTLVATGSLPLWQGQLMSLAIYAGSSQFIGVGLFTAGASALVIVATTFIVNLRHMLYAATLLPYLQHLSRTWRAVLGFVITDETFAVAHARLSQPAHRPLGHWYMLGSGIAMYINWSAWTLAGLAFGAAIPQLSTLGLDFAMAVTFIAIVVPQLRSRPNIAAALVSGVCAVLWRAWPYKLGLLGAVALGIAVGMLLARRHRALEERRA